jgi:hypothetical protein
MRALAICAALILGAAAAQAQPSPSYSKVTINGAPAVAASGTMTPGNCPVIASGSTTTNPLIADSGSSNCGGGGSGSVASGTGPAIAQYPAGTSAGVGPATVSGDATIAQGGALTLKNTGTSGTYGGDGSHTISITTDQAGRVSGVSVYPITPGAIGAQSSITSSAGQIITNNGGTLQGSTASGDATISGTGAVTVGAIGGKSVSLGGALTTAGSLTTSGANALTLTTTGTTNSTLPAGTHTLLPADNPVATTSAAVDGAQNNIVLTPGASAGAHDAISATGSDTNVSIDLDPKGGAGTVNVINSTNSSVLQFNPSSSTGAVIASANTSASGNVNLTLVAQADGSVVLQSGGVGVLSVTNASGTTTNPGLQIASAAGVLTMTAAASSGNVDLTLTPQGTGATRLSADPSSSATGTQVVDASWVLAKGYSTTSGQVNQGGWNASTNTPTLTTGTCATGTVGYYWQVTTGGTTTLGSYSTWTAGQQAQCAAGGNWFQYTPPSAGVASVAGTSPVSVSTASGVATVSVTTIPVGSGGTGATTLASGGLLVGNSTSAIGTVGTTVAGVQGNGTKVQLSTGTPVSGDGVKYDANGNAVDSGSAILTSSGIASFAFTSPTLSTPAAYNDASTRIPNDAWAQSNFISQYENNPACIGIFSTLSGVPVPCATDGLIYVLSNQQFYTFTPQATPVTTGAQSGTSGSITVTGTSPYYVAGAYVTNGTYITNTQTTVTTISGVPTVSGGNTTFTLSNPTISAIPSGTTLNVANYVVQPQPGQNITCGSPGCISSSTLPLASTTTAGAVQVDGVIFAAPSGVLSCVTGKCLTPDGISLGATAAGTLIGLTDQPVCGNLSYMGDSSPTAAGSQISTRTVLYCPNGAKSVRLLLTAGYLSLSTATPPLTEIAGVNPVVWNLSIEPNLPAPWNSTTTYTGGSPGTCVSQMPTQSTATGYTNNPIYCALLTNTNVPPTPGSTSWAAGVSQQVVPMTCNGGRPCTLHTSITATGALQTDGVVLTDPVPVNVPAGGYIAVRGFAAMQAGQITATGPGQKPYAGSYSSVGTSRTDNTLSGGLVVSGAAPKTVAFAAIGQAPTGTPVPTVCYLGDARAESASGSGVTTATIVSGGSAYTNNDIGAVVSISNTGASSGAVITGAQLMIQNVNVSSGAVTAVGVYEPGHYSISGLSGGTLPSGTQTTSGGGTTGSGLTVTIGSFTSGNSGLYEAPATLAPGGIAQGLAAGGVPYTGFAHAVDTAAEWVTQGGDSARLNAIKATGCSSALIALGLQDVANSATAATLEANLSMIANQLLGLGTVKAVYIATMPPVTGSTDGWATVTNQTLGGGNAVRVSVNDWARTTPAPFSGYVDLAAPVEVGTSNSTTPPDGGYILTNGSKYYVTPDGTNFTPTGYGLEAAAVAAYAASPGFK